MCGRYCLAGPDPSALRMRWPLGESVEVRRRYNVAPGDDVLCVTTGAERSEPQGELLRWGLVPHWADDPRTGFRMINARSETAAEKPAFRDALARRRCLVLADGFYEWQTVPGGTPSRPRKRPWHVTRADGRPYAFAGLWATWRAPGQEGWLRSCTILTGAASGPAATIHDRLPLILADEDAEARWLAGGPIPPVFDDLALRAVGTAVNDARHDAPDCLDDAPPEEPAAAAQPTLF